MALFIVTNLNDSGAGSLRQAIIDANGTAAADTIEFDASIAGGLIELMSGPLVIQTDITINGDTDGDGRFDIGVSGDNSDQIFQITDTVNAAFLRSLYLTEGLGVSGGAITSQAGYLAIVNTLISQSLADYGGALHLTAASTTTKIVNSTFSGNVADYGGGIAVSGGGSGVATIILENATISGNTANDQGGGIASLYAANFDVFNSTITANGANDGGGIALTKDGTLDLTNTILSANSGGSEDDLAADTGSVISAEHSLIGTGATLTNDLGGNISSDAPGVTSLADNGGPVPTHALEITSPAMSAGDVSLLPADSQDLDGDADTSEALPLDANGNARVTDTLDIGAAEFVKPTLLIVDTLDDADDGDYGTGELSLREAIDLVADNGTIQFSSTITGGTTAGVDDGVISVTSSLSLYRGVTIDGDTGEDDKADITLDFSANYFGSNLLIDTTSGPISLRSLEVADALGPGIRAYGSGTLNVINSTIRDGTGTGIRMYSSDVNIIGSTLSGNSDSAVRSVTFSDPGDLTIINSTLTGNEAPRGGAIFARGTTIIENSTITGNNATEYGGGIAARDPVIVENSILAGNTAGPSPSAIFPDSYTYGAFGALNAKNSVLGTGVSADTTNIFTDAPGLMALADNGGPVQTMALTQTSAALGLGDASLLPLDVFDLDNDGDTAEALPLDADGGARIQGPTYLDAGAVEGPPPASLVVDTLSDVVDGDYTAGNLSLREAIDLIGVGGTITFDAALTGGTTNGVDNGRITLNGSELDVTQDMTINGDVDGDGHADIIIDANDASRAVRVFSEVFRAEVTLYGLTLTNGYSAYGGGALRAVAIEGGYLSLINSQITNSESATIGGGLFADDVTIVNTTFSFNDAAEGGAAYLYGNGTTTLQSATLYSNDVTGTNRGGALLLAGADSQLENVTVSGNNALNGKGGGIAIVGFNATTATINNSTIFENRADTGGGVYLYGEVDLTLQNTILSGNIATTTGPDFVGLLGASGAPTITSQNGLLGTGVTLNTNAGGNVVTDNPDLAFLIDNGGFVKTHALNATSLGLDAGDATLLSPDAFDLDGDGNTTEALPFDARGGPREIGVLDIGAYESEEPLRPTALVVSTLVDEDDGDYSAGDLSLREAIDQIADGGSITFLSSLTGGTTPGVDDGQIVLGGTALAIERSVSIDGDVDGDGRADVTVDGDASSAVFAISSVGNTVDVTLRGLDIANGGVGGIETSFINSLSLINSTVRDSVVSGGIRTDAATLNVINSTISNNQSTGYGGGISIQNGTFRIENSTISGNTATSGAAISTYGNGVIANSTLSGNTGNSATGGIEGGVVTITNSILSGNIVTGAGSNNASASTITSQNSVLGTDLSGGTNNVFTDNPMLGALADNGGPVMTRGLLAGSAAIGVGDASLLASDTFDIDGDGDTAEQLPVDANGVARIFGPSGLDAGAVEANDAPSVTLRDLFGIEVGTFTTIAAAVAAASDGFTVEVSAGYLAGPESVSTGLNNLTFDMASGTSVSVSMTGGSPLNASSIGAGSVDFTGNAQNNTFNSGIGPDTLNGGAGTDTADFSASVARVLVDMAAGTSSLGHAEGDTFISIENLIGSDFNDRLAGGTEANVFIGGLDNDNISGRGGNDSILGEEGDDLISGGNNDDTIDGGTENDSIFGNGGDDSIVGGSGADTIFGGVGVDTLRGGNGEDEISGQGSDDHIVGQNGNDILRGGSGNDSIEGGAQDDLLLGNGNNDTLLGGAGNDTLQGAAGADNLQGGNGNDTLTGSDGADRLDGGAGNDVMNGGGLDNARDVYVFHVGYDEDRINAFDQAGTDRIELDEDLWLLSEGVLSAQGVVDEFGTLNMTGTILTLDFRNGDILEVQNAAGINDATLGSDILIV